jgi:6-phosphogluconate dehydrogenase
MTRTLFIVSSKSGTAAIDEGVPAEVLSAALYARFRSRREHTFADKILAMREGFGGQVEPKAGRS